MEDIIKIPIRNKDLQNYPILQPIFEMKTRLNSLSFAFKDLLEPEYEDKKIKSTIIERLKLEIAIAEQDPIIMELPQFQKANQLSKKLDLLLKLERRNFDSCLKAINDVFNHLLTETDVLKGFLPDEGEITKPKPKETDIDDLYA